MDMTNITYSSNCKNKYSLPCTEEGVLLQEVQVYGYQVPFLLVDAKHNHQ